MMKPSMMKAILYMSMIIILANATNDRYYSKYQEFMWGQRNLEEVDSTINISSTLPQTATNVTVVQSEPVPSNTTKGSDEFETITEKIAEHNSNSCLHGGKMQNVFKQIPLNISNSNDINQKYLCICPYNYIGLRCEECARGYFGPHCHPCSKHPISNIICGEGNVCDDGIEGKGKCYCRDSSKDPLTFCETKIDSNHQKNDETTEFGFFLMVIVGFFVCILLYIYKKRSIH